VADGFISATALGDLLDCQQRGHFTDGFCDPDCASLKYILREYIFCLQLVKLWKSYSVVTTKAEEGDPAESSGPNWNIPITGLLQKPPLLRSACDVPSLARLTANLSQAIEVHTEYGAQGLVMV
jgi:hypothetical protein